MTGEFAVNRRMWLIAGAAAALLFSLGFVAGKVGRPTRPARVSYRSIGGYQAHHLVIDDRSANVYYVAPTGIRYVGNMRDAQRPPNWPPVPAGGK